MIVETVRISDSGRQQLIRLKTKTGIKQWNVLCRWGLALSLAEPSVPPVEKHEDSSGLEIVWKVFAGSLSAPLAAAIRLRFNRDKSMLPGMSEQEYFDLHLHRGISYLSANVAQSIGDLSRLAIDSRPP